MRHIGFEQAQREADEMKVDGGGAPSNGNSLVVENRELEREVARLKAELEALRPKPVVEVITAPVRISRSSHPHFGAGLTFEHRGVDNLKLTFTDGILTKAEVLSDK